MAYKGTLENPTEILIIEAKQFGYKSGTAGKLGADYTQLETVIKDIAARYKTLGNISEEAAFAKLEQLCSDAIAKEQLKGFLDKAKGNAAFKEQFIGDIVKYKDLLDDFGKNGDLLGNYVAVRTGDYSLLREVKGKFENYARWLETSKAAGSILGKITKTGNKVEYINPAGNILKWTEQHPSSITQSIQSALNNAGDAGKQVEGKVANFVQQEGKMVEAFGMKIDNYTTGNPAGDIDVMTNNAIIEVKRSYAGWVVKPTEQVNKFVNTVDFNFFNPSKRKAILYIEVPLNAIERDKILNTIPNNVFLANSLNDLKNLL